MTVEISTTAGVQTRDRDRAIDKIERLVRSIDAPVLHVDLRLSVDQDPARGRPAHARALLNLNGEPIRAHVSAATVHEAIDLLDARLRRRLKTLAEHRQAIRRRGPESPSGEWRHGDLPAERGPFFDRPATDREIVRHKSFATPDASVDEAIFDLESMDYDFYLFTDAQTGFDAVVWRTADGCYGLRYANGEVPAPESILSAAALELDERPVPVLSIDDARMGLDDTGDPWLVYRDPEHGRARILYRRYDGHYGMLTPAGE